jgi:integrase
MAYIQERTTKDGKKRFRVQVRLKGYPVQTETFERKTDAKKWAQQTESAIQEGRHFKTTASKKHTLSDMIDRYIEMILPTKPKSQEVQEGQLKWWKSEVGAYTLCDVTPAMIGECRDKLLQGKTNKGTLRTPATGVRYLAALSHAFSVAVNEWGWLEDNPVRKVKKPVEPRGRVRFLSEEERPALLMACKQSHNKCLYTIVVLALSSGMRYSEIMTLTWKDVDLVRNCIILQETKNGERRNVPIAGHALNLLKEHNKVRSLEGHEAPEDYAVAVRNHQSKINSFIKKDYDNEQFNGNIKLVNVDEYNYREYLTDENTMDVPIDYYASTVAKKDFILWAVKKKIKLPEEFSKLVDTQEEPAEDKNTKKMISSAVRAGIFCASQGVDVKKEQLQTELDMYGPSFEAIWKEVPKQFKEPGGRPKKVVEKIIETAVYATYYISKNCQRMHLEKLAEILAAKKSLGSIDPQYLKMIKDSIDTYVIEE